MGRKDLTSYSNEPAGGNGPLVVCYAFVGRSTLVLLVAILLSACAVNPLGTYVNGPSVEYRTIELLQHQEFKAELWSDNGLNVCTAVGEWKYIDEESQRIETVVRSRTNQSTNQTDNVCIGLISDRKVWKVTHKGLLSPGGDLYERVR